jgi:protein SCO1/2
MIDPELRHTPKEGIHDECRAISSGGRDQRPPVWSGITGGSAGPAADRRAGLGDMGAPIPPLKRNHGWLLAAAVALLLAVFGVGYARTLASATTPILHGDAVWSSGVKTAPTIRLRDQSGRIVSLASLHGHVVLLTFLDSLCTADCPLEGGMLRNIQRRVPPADRPEVLVVSVDPADTPTTVGSFVRESHLSPPWHWLMGTRAQLAKVWRAYGITVIPRAGDISHSTVLYLIDQHGDERAGFLFPFPVGEVAHDVRAISATQQPGWPW